MIKNDNILDELFRSKLQNYEQEPSPNVWNRIAEKMEMKKRKRVLLFWKSGGIAAAILLAFLLGRLMEQKELIPTLNRLNNRQAENSPLENSGAGSDLSHQGSLMKGKRDKPHPVTINNNFAAVEGMKISLDRSNENKSGVLKNVSSASGEESYSGGREYLALLDVSLKISEQVDQLRSKSGREKKLSARDLAIIEMNKKFIETSTLKKADRNWSVGAFAAPAFSVNQTSYNDSYASSMSYAKEINSLYMNAGIQVKHQVGKRWSIESGLYYNHQGIVSDSHSSKSYMLADPSPGNSYSVSQLSVQSGTYVLNASAGSVELDKLPSGTYIASSLDAVSANSNTLLSGSDIEQSFRYLEIPVYIRYRLAEKKISVDISGGFGANVLVGNDVYMADGNEKTRIGKTKDMNLLNYSASTGLGLGYPLSGKIRIQVEPRFRYFINSLNNSSSVSYKPYSFGIYTGLSYRF